MWSRKLPSFNPKKFTKANLHKLLIELILETSLSETNEVDNDENELNVEPTLLVNSTSANSINPGDIPKPMSAPVKDKASSSEKENRTAFSREVTMNSKTYREVGQHVIFYLIKLKSPLIKPHIMITTWNMMKLIIERKNLHLTLKLHLHHWSMGSIYL